MGLIRGMARTAVIAGTATAVSNNVSRRQARRWGQQEYDQQVATAQQQQPLAAPAPAAGDAMTAELERLGQLRSSGVISEEEFVAAKAKVLGL